MQRILNPNLVAVAAILAAVIVYGSLYPFVFNDPHGPGPLKTLLENWEYNYDRSDVPDNILLYVPLGFFCVSALRIELGFTLRLLIAILIGAGLSFGIELLQYYAPRVPALRDVYANTFGTAVGAIAGVLLVPGTGRSLADLAIAKPFPILILTAWVGYRLFPYVPGFDLRFLDALRPLVSNPTLPLYDLYRYTVSWLVVCALVEAIVEKNRSLRLAPIFVGGLIFAKLLIAERVLTWAELIGAVAGFGLWLLLAARSRRVQAAIIAMLLGVFILAWRLQPFQFSTRAGAFGWIPFLSMMRGSMAINTQSFLEKMFYYGALVWLITVSGARLQTAAICVALLLLGTSAAEVYLPGRSAEATAAFMVLVVVLIVTLIRRARGPVNVPSSASAKRVAMPAAHRFRQG